MSNDHAADSQAGALPSGLTSRRTLFDTPELTVIRQRSAESHAASPIIAVPYDDAFSIITQLADFKSHKLWRGKRLMHVGGHAKTSISITHLLDEWRCQHLSAFDNLRFHIPRSALDAYTEEAGLKKIAGFTIAPDRRDPVVFHLAQALLPALACPETINRLQVDHLVLALFAHLTSQYGRMPRTSERQFGSCAAR